MRGNWEEYVVLLVGIFVVRPDTGSCQESEFEETHGGRIGIYLMVNIG
jgi:hypothetical protein